MYNSTNGRIAKSPLNAILPANNLSGVTVAGIPDALEAHEIAFSFYGANHK